MRTTLAVWRPELVDEVLAAIASPIDRALGRELAREYRPSRLASHERRTSREERLRRAERRRRDEDLAIATFEAFIESEIAAGEFPEVVNVDALRRAS